MLSYLCCPKKESCVGLLDRVAILERIDSVAFFRFECLDKLGSDTRFDIIA